MERNACPQKLKGGESHATIIPLQSYLTKIEPNTAWRKQVHKANERNQKDDKKIMHYDYLRCVIAWFDFMGDKMTKADVNKTCKETPLRPRENMAFLNSLLRYNVGMVVLLMIISI